MQINMNIGVSFDGDLFVGYKAMWQEQHRNAQATEGVRAG